MCTCRSWVCNSARLHNFSSKSHYFMGISCSTAADQALSLQPLSEGAIATGDGAQLSVEAWKVSTRRRRRLLIAASAIARVAAPSATAYASANTPVAMHAAAGNKHSAQLRRGTRA